MDLWDYLDIDAVVQYRCIHNSVVHHVSVMTYILLAKYKCFRNVVVSPSFCGYVVYM
jgi:hypothetical protein